MRRVALGGMSLTIACGAFGADPASTVVVPPGADAAVPPGPPAPPAPPAVLDVHTLGDLALDPPVEDQQVVPAIDGAMHDVEMHVVAKGDGSDPWSAAYASATLDGAHPVGAPGAAIPSANTAQLDCGIIRIDTGSSPDYTVTVEEAVLEDCPP